MLLDGSLARKTINVMLRRC